MNHYEVTTRAAEPISVFADDMEINETGDLVFYMVEGNAPLSSKEIWMAFAAGSWAHVKSVGHEPKS